MQCKQWIINDARQGSTEAVEGPKSWGGTTNRLFISISTSVLFSISTKFGGAMVPLAFQLPAPLVDDGMSDLLCWQATEISSIKTKTVKRQWTKPLTLHCTFYYSLSVSDLIWDPCTKVARVETGLDYFTHHIFIRNSHILMYARTFIYVRTVQFCESLQRHYIACSECDKHKMSNKLSNFYCPVKSRITWPSNYFMRIGLKMTDKQNDLKCGL